MGCPNWSICPVQCGPEEVFCPGSFDENGCKFPDMCLYPPMDINGQSCPPSSVCPVMCNPEVEDFCPGGIDGNGCKSGDLCMPRAMGANGEFCPASCPVQCGPQEIHCP